MVDQCDQKTREQGHLKENLQCYVFKTRAVGRMSIEQENQYLCISKEAETKQLNIVGIGLFSPLVINFCHISLPGLAVIAHF